MVFFVFGLFSFVGKIAKGIGKLIPGVSTAINAVEMAGSLLGSKSPGTGSAVKMAAINRLGVAAARGNATQGGYGGGGVGGLFSKVAGVKSVLMTAQQMRASPVMPGGSIASTRGVMMKTSRPPATFGGKSGGRTRRRSKVSSVRRGAGRLKKRTTRKLKFGSPAWRKKYMRKRR